MRAAVFAGAGRVEVREVPEPAMERDDDVVVAVAACGICGSDLRALSVPPTMSVEPGVVMGHEMVGEVVDAGPRARAELGRRVVVLPNLHCGRCANCKRGAISWCDEFEHVGATRDGGFAERCVVPAGVLHRVPDDVDTRLAALAEPLACVLNGTRRADWHPGSSAVIIGAGPIGLLFAAVARLAGVTPLVVSEPSAARREWAKRVGADMVVDPTVEALDEAVREATDGHGADVVVDAVGTLLPNALRCLRKGGRALLFGLDLDATVEVRPSVIAARELRVEGVYITRGTFPLALELLRRRGDAFAPLLTHEFPLDAVSEGVAAMRSAEAVKALVLP